jgi:hypothetical protein
VTSFVAIYSALGLRDERIESSLGQALRRTSFPNLTRLRRDPPRIVTRLLAARRALLPVDGADFRLNAEATTTKLANYLTI